MREQRSSTLTNERQTALYYSGKFLDTFEMALSQLLESLGAPQIPFADCASLRSFGFRAEGAVKTWFQPYVTLPAALDALSKAVGAVFCCEAIGSPEDLFRNEQSVLLGPVTAGGAVTEARDYYYHGYGTYLFVRPISADKLEVFDPHGFPGLCLPKAFLNTALQQGSPFRIWAKDVPRFSPPADLSSLLECGLRFHRDIRVQEHRSIERACSQYRPSRENELSLQYGMMNLLLQMDKNFRLAASCGRLSPQAEHQYILEKQRLYRLRDRESLSALPGVIENIWSILENGQG